MSGDRALLAIALVLLGGMGFLMHGLWILAALAVVLTLGGALVRNAESSHRPSVG